MFYLALFFIFVFNPKGNYYKPKWAVFSAFCCGLLGYHIGLVSNIYFGLLFFYISFFAIYYCIYDMFKHQNLYIEMENAKTGVIILSCGIFFLLVSKEMINDFFIIIPYVLIANTLFKLIPKKYRSFDYENRKVAWVGIGSNPSTDSTLMSLMLAMMLTYQYPYYLKEIAVVASAFSFYKNRATAGILAYGLSVLLWLIFIVKAYLVLSIYITCAIIIAYKHRKELFNPNGRIEIWKFVFQKLVNKKNIIFGIGSGSFKLVMPVLQIQEAQKVNPGREDYRHTQWAHNDFVEFFASSGIIGTVLGLIFVGSIVVNFGINEWIIFSAIGISMAFNFPCHLAPDCLIILMCVRNLFK